MNQMITLGASKLWEIKLSIDGLMYFQDTISTTSTTLMFSDTGQTEPGSFKNAVYWIKH